MEPGSESCSACGQSLPTPEESSLQAPERIQIKEVKIGEYFTGGWNLFKKYPVGFISYFIIVVLIHIITDIVNFLVPFIGLLVWFALVCPLFAGFFVVNAKLLKNQTPEFVDFFGGFKLFLPLALLGVVSSILIAIGLILLIVPGIYLIVSYLFAYMFVVDRGLNFWRAMELSRRSVQTRWFPIFALFLLVALIYLGPFLLLVLMWIFSAPILNTFVLLLAIILILLIMIFTGTLSHCILTVAYADIFGIESAYTISMRQ
jgi:hypothetical protein